MEQLLIGGSIGLIVGALVGLLVGHHNAAAAAKIASVVATAATDIKKL